MRNRIKPKRELVSVGAGQDTSYIKGGLLGKREKKVSNSVKRAELLFTSFETGMVSVNKKPICYITKKHGFTGL